MDKLIGYIQIAIFGLALSVPTLMFLFDGPSGPFERRTQTAFPTFSSVIGSDSEYRDQLSDAIFERSTAKKSAISLKSEISRDIFRFVDQGDVVSGDTGWLFHKSAFSNWDCSNHPRLMSQLERFEIVVEVADAANADILFVVAPNKASVNKSAIKGRASMMAACYLEFENEFRSAMRAIGSERIIDHFQILNESTDVAPTYYQTDTHWNSFGDALATEQVLERIPFDPAVDVSVSELPDTLETSGDLNQMLLSSRREPERSFTVTVTDEAIDAISRFAQGSRIRIVHDSFYARIEPLFQAIAPDISFERVGLETFKNLELAPSDFIIVQVVERNFLQQAGHPDFFGWGSPIGDWLLERSAEAAAECDWDSGLNLMEASPQLSSTANLGRSELDAWVTENGDQQLKVAIPSQWGGDQVCFNVVVESDEPSPIQLFLPVKKDAKAAVSYSGGASILLYPDDRTVSMKLVLPSRVAGETIRLRPSRRAGAKITDLTIAAKSTGD